MRTLLARYWCCIGAEDKLLDIKKKHVGTWRIFSLRELHAATNNFNYDNKLGEGSFGSVYWGQLASGDQIAVKRLKIWSTKAEMEFAVEIEILGRVRHKNLLSLRGYCAEGQERVIVYDYMPKLSLLSHLHGQFAADATLDWQRRMKIAVGIAEGLAYLHHFATPHIVHRDIKASNVLLDDAFEAQVADFGLAKLIPDGAPQVSLAKGKGATLGYMAPEREVAISCAQAAAESCDVYSFGVLLLEIVSGRKPIERVVTPLEGAKHSTRSIMDWAGPLFSQGKYHDIVDPKLQGAFRDDELTKLVQVASICAQSAPEARPTMLDVVEMLKEPSKISPTKALPEEGKTPQTSEPVKHHEPAVMEGSELKTT